MRVSVFWKYEYETIKMTRKINGSITKRTLSLASPLEKCAMLAETRVIAKPK